MLRTFRYELADGAGPMQMLSSASSTGSDFSSASEYVTTVWIPSSCAARSIRRAISPRLAISIFLNILRATSARLYSEKWLTVLDRILVPDKHLSDYSVRFRLDLVHELHRLYDAEDRAPRDPVAHLHVIVPVRRGSRVERADDGRDDIDELWIERSHHRRRLRLCRCRGSRLHRAGGRNRCGSLLPRHRLNLGG